jgi:hypothetical protein
MDIFKIKLDGESTIEYSLRRANFKCYDFVLGYSIRNFKLVDNNGQEVQVDTTSRVLK